MTFMERWSLHLAVFVTAGTGALEGYLRWFGLRMGEFGPEAHPWLGAAQHAHVLAAPVLVFTLGMILRGHFSPMLQRGTREGRSSGLALALVILPMVAGGYLVQVVVDPFWRNVFAWVHGVASLTFMAVYLGHAARGWRKAQAEKMNLSSRSLGSDLGL